MRSIFSIITQATRLTLLTIEEMRSVAGVTGSGSDPELEAMGARVSAAITTECGVAVAGGKAPTLMREGCQETFFSVSRSTVFLSRRHDVEIVSVSVDAVEIAEDQFGVDPESGELFPICDGFPGVWTSRSLSVVYDAGFSDIPHDLKMCAMDFFRLAWLEKGRDPALKSREIDVANVQRTREDYWVGAVPGQAGEGAVPATVAGQLDRFRNVWVR